VDMIKVNNDIALVYSWDAPDIRPSGADPQRRVYFQWWRYDGTTANGDWRPDPAGPVLVFAPGANEAYHRAQLAVDSLGRIWVQAWKRFGGACTTAACQSCVPVTDGDNYPNQLAIAVSTNGGPFQQQQSFAATMC